MNTVLEEKIMAAKLTKTESIIAQFVLENEARVGFMTAADIAGELGTSDASVIRMARAVGYSGFNELQKEIQESISYKVRFGSNRVLPPAEKLLSSMDILNSNDIVNESLHMSIKNLESTISYNSLEKIDAVSNALIKSRRIYFVGFRVAAGIATALTVAMGHILPDARAVTSSDFASVEMFNGLTEDDCVFFISFPRYPKIIDTLFEMAKDKGAKTIFMTEGVASPNAREADIILSTSVDSISFFNSYMAPLFLAELIAADVSRKNGAGGEKIMKRLDYYVNKAGLY